MTDEIGVREKSLSAFCDSPGFKIITLGDSYTEGVGAPYDSSWPRFIERDLLAGGHRLRVFDAGMSGGDPFFEFALYRDKLASCNADATVVAINSTDIDDFFFRGGMERFQTDGRVVNKKGPWYEFLYHYSYVVRLLFVDILGQKQQMFVSDREYEKTEQEFIQSATKLFKEWKALMGNSGRLIVIIHPQPTECAYAVQKGNKHTYTVMLRLLENIRKENIAAVNLYPPLEAAISESNWMQYTYEHDKHFNGTGYKLFAEKLREEMDKAYPGILK